MSGKRGPKIKLTDSGRKRRKQERNAIVNKSRMSIGYQIDRWNDIKTQLSIEIMQKLQKYYLTGMFTLHHFLRIILIISYYIVDGKYCL